MIDIDKLRQALGAVQPEEVEELLDRLEAAEKDIALKERVIDALGSELNAVANERDELRAKIGVMEQQEPVRHEFQGRDGVWRPFLDQRHYENTVADGTWPVRALYAPLAHKEKRND